MSLPILYSFRRCPYAMRARTALISSGTAFELREVVLRDKPASLLAASGKGSVPVLVLPDGNVIDESWDIMLWALRQHDPEGWLGVDGSHVQAALPWVTENDTSFKRDLDRYKYPGRFPGHTQDFYRAAGEEFLQRLESRLCATRYLLGDSLSIADVAVLPFVRQFAAVNQRLMSPSLADLTDGYATPLVAYSDWFATAPYPALRAWLENFTRSELFAAVMQKFPAWQAGETLIILGSKRDR